MMVTFISQCEINALKKTRRVLDAFADRIGDNTWQTVNHTGGPENAQENGVPDRHPKHRSLLPVEFFFVKIMGKYWRVTI